MGRHRATHEKSETSIRTRIGIASALSAAAGGLLLKYVAAPLMNSEHLSRTGELVAMGAPAAALVCSTVTELCEASGVRPRRAFALGSAVTAALGGGAAFALESTGHISGETAAELPLVSGIGLAIAGTNTVAANMATRGFDRPWQEREDLIDRGIMDYYKYNPEP